MKIHTEGRGTPEPAGSALSAARLCHTPIKAIGSAIIPELGMEARKSIIDSHL